MTKRKKSRTNTQDVASAAILWFDGPSGKAPESTSMPEPAPENAHILVPTGFEEKELGLALVLKSFESNEKKSCGHYPGEWCACWKFTPAREDLSVRCRICGSTIDHPEYTPAPHDAHGVCIIEEGRNHYTADPQVHDGLHGGE